MPEMRFIPWIATVPFLAFLPILQAGKSCGRSPELRFAWRMLMTQRSASCSKRSPNKRLEFTSPVQNLSSAHG
jgi:hypothetical protein